MLKPDFHTGPHPPARLGNIADIHIPGIPQIGCLCEHASRPVVKENPCIGHPERFKGPDSGKCIILVAQVTARPILPGEVGPESTMSQQRQREMQRQTQGEVDFMREMVQGVVGQKLATLLSGVQIGILH